MIELEKLYVCAENHLTATPMSWEGFAVEFKAIFQSEFVLFRPELEADGQTIRSFGLIVTTDPSDAAQTVVKKMYAECPVPETLLAPLEPSRRSDVMSDPEFREFCKAVNLPEGHGLFFVMAAPALMPDGSPIILITWRDEHRRDYSDLEKQRISLFMRYLLKLLKPSEDPASTPDAGIQAFGTKHHLTPTEVEILSALLRGRSLKDISRETDRSYGTVRWHVQNILEKCHVRSQKRLMSEFYQLIEA